MSRRRWLLIGILYVCLVGIGWFVGHWLADIAVIDIRPSNEPAIHRMILTSIGIFILASALPFVPGAEIGFAMILAFGMSILLLVYVAMVCALLLAFLMGRFIPERVTAAAFAFFGMRKARDLVLKIAPLSAEERLALLTAQAPTRIIPFLLRHRYLALAVVINLPGNTLIGGGGGIALAAGMSGLYPTLPFALTVALAVAPMPLLFLLTGHLLFAE